MGVGDRLVKSVVVAAAVVVATSACTSGLACTEIGYSNVLGVTVTGELAADVTALRLCSDAGCVDGTRTADPDEWWFDLGLEAPPEPEVTAFDAEGTELSSAPVTVNWQITTRPNGPGCDNMSTASPVTFEVSGS
ncbi:hypothetical protein ACFUTX_08925 [Microbacterium sp. NPDC057407]|uniref:hypothetical protein n=1 Tax=Microbacterium sp. NPDC057407 TaxID=3346120 RepID=UPI00367033A6